MSPRMARSCASMVKRGPPGPLCMRGVVLAFALFALTGLSGCLEGEQDPSTASTGGSASTSTSGSATTSLTNASAPAAANVTGDDEEGNRTATNQAPVVGSYGYNATGLTVVVSFNASDPDEDALSYTISFGDGSANATGTNATGNATHAYAEAGSYNVTLVVSDGTLSANRTIQVNVTAAAPAGPVKTFKCTMTAGSSPGPSVRGTVNIGACSMGTTTEPMTVVAIRAPSGCTVKYDVNPGDTSLTGDAKVGETYAKGTEFVLSCAVGAISPSGELDARPASA